RHAADLQRLDNSIAPLPWDANRIHRPERGVSVGDPRGNNDIAEPVGVALGDAVTHRNLVVKDLELFDQDRGLHGIEPRGEAEADIIVLVAAMTVHAYAAK